MDHEGLSASVVAAIARATDLPLASTADAALIAAGAQRAIEAVRAMGHLELFDTEPADFLPVLEQLASDPGAAR